MTREAAADTRSHKTDADAGRAARPVGGAKPTIIGWSGPTVIGRAWRRSPALIAKRRRR